MMQQEWEDLLDTLPKGLIYVVLSESIAVPDESKRTIGVRVDDDGRVVIAYNPEFWEGLSLEERRFCVCHEALHIVLEHWTRWNRSKEAGIAADLTVNHLIVNHYNLVDRADIRFARELCWVDTVFRRHKVGVSESFEFYLDKVMSLPRVSIKHLLDDHDFEVDPTGLEHVKERVKTVFGRLKSDMEDFDVEDLDRNLAKDFYRVSIDWNAILVGIFGKFLPGEQMHWLYNRRLSAVEGDFCIPSEHEDIEKPSVSARIYVDTSKSCARYVDAFLKAVAKIPAHVDCQVKGFCGKVYDIKGRVPSLYTGTTSFSIIERDLLKEKHYPECVVVLTDGYGDTVNPLYPKRWNWVLVEKCETYVPKQSRIWRAYV